MLFQQLINGLSLGMIYALIAVGYSLVFGILRLVNMSHGAVYALGAHVALLFVTLEWGWGPALILSCVLTAIINVGFDRIVLAPLREKNTPSIAALISTVGFSYIVQNLLMIAFGSERKPFPKIFDFGVWNVAGIRLNSTQVVIALVSLVMLSVFTLLIYRTSIGLSMRGTEQKCACGAAGGRQCAQCHNLYLCPFRDFSGPLQRFWLQATTTLFIPQWVSRLL